MKMFQTKQLSYQYPEADSCALNQVNVSVEQGEFILLLGASGSGKSTFLRSLNGLVPRFYGGKLGGQVDVRGKSIDEWAQRDIVSTIGFVNQDPERQLLLDSVEREIVFGMENLGTPQEQMKGRLAEISHLFDLHHLLGRQTASLSGGEKQLIAMASILTTYPEALLLDEPTSQLDPVHAETVLHALRRLNEEWGMTIVLSEHRVERCFHLADRIILFDQGQVVFQGTPRDFVAQSEEQRTEWRRFIPPITRHFLEQNLEAQPITVKEARSLRNPALLSGNKESTAQERTPSSCQALLQLDQIKAGYHAHTAVLNNLSYTILSGDRIALLGENGAGKSTLAKVMSQVVSIQRGSMMWEGDEISSAFTTESWKQIGYLSQNPNDYLLHDTIEDELVFAVRHAKSGVAINDRVEELLELSGLGKYRHRHPHDLSGGERQLLALTLVLVNTPKLLLLDEPTRGLDLMQKQKLSQLLHTLPVNASLVITHDVEFAQLYANRVSVLYQGEIVADGSPDQVFANSFSYMPQVHKYYR
ncbi:ABC transporter ATP-binding protein [Brevibacillus ginsengisoli]|uniref:ABC transporter ATP-binding protein n=1 Tax=Brevibacillus ginsengisoli TaxID=363854 RepID=UPI003CF0CD9C